MNGAFLPKCPTVWHNSSRIEVLEKLIRRELNSIFPSIIKANPRGFSNIFRQFNALSCFCKRSILCKIALSNDITFSLAVLPTIQ